MMSLQQNHICPLKDARRFDDEFGRGYDHALLADRGPVPADCWVHDAWIVTAAGKLHPGLNTAPVPVRPEDLFVEAGRRFSCRFPHFEGTAHMDAQLSRGLILNVPHFFANPEFRTWLEADRPKFTWHRGGHIDEWSDVVVLVDPGLNGEGSDSDMPAECWETIVALCREHLVAGRAGEPHVMVRLTNLTD